MRIIWMIVSVTHAQNVPLLPGAKDQASPDVRQLSVKQNLVIKHPNFSMN